MNSTGIRPLGRVILATTGEGRDWSALQDYLRGLDREVDLFDPTPSSDLIESSDRLPLMRGVDLAIVMVPPEDGDGESAIGRRLAYLAGVFKGRLGDTPVLMMLEYGARPPVVDVGVVELHYERDKIEARFPFVTSLLAERSAAAANMTASPWLERLGIIEGRVAPELLLMLGALAVIMSVLAVLGLQFLGSTDGADPEDAGNGSTTSLGAEAFPDAPERSGGFGPGDAGSIEGLPARCIVETKAGGLLADAVTCDGLGRLQVEGYRGPWHLEIQQLQVDVGVAGDVVIVSTTGIERIPVLGGGPQTIADPQGVDRLELLFSANGQSVTFGQVEDRGGNTVTLTYALTAG